MNKLPSIALQLILLASLVVVFNFSIQSGDRGIALAALFGLFLSNVSYSLSQFREKIIFLLFNVSFLFFFLGRLALQYLIPEDTQLAHGPDFSSDVQSHILTLLFVSLVCARLGFMLAFKPDYVVVCESTPTDNRYKRAVRSTSKVGMYITLLPQLLVLAERASFVSTAGYEAYYVEYTSQLPLIVIRAASVYAPLTYLFLATLPSRQECRLPLALFLLVGVVSLGFGQRNAMVLNILFVIAYLALRDSLAGRKWEWMSKRQLLLGVAALPGFLFFLSAFAFYRSGTQLSFQTFTDGIKVLFLSQGASANLIGYASQYHDILPADRFYSLGPLIAFFTENKVAEIFLGTTTHPPASVALAREGNQFSFAIAYLINPDYYMRGGGYGSSYIAELWVDFGVYGVIAGSSLYGALMAKFVPLCRRNLWIASFVFASMFAIVYAPRAEFLGFLKPVLSSATLVTYLTIHYLARLTSRGTRVAHPRVR